MNSEHTIDLGYIEIAGKFWGPAKGEPTLALHGFLDNANSFDMIAPGLTDLRVFAMDLAGHGWSGHRRDGELYPGLNDIRDVLAVADALGWTRFNLIGHSMGAEIGSQIAGLFPERVNRLICIDGYCGTNGPDETIGHLRSTIESSFKSGSNLRVFATLEEMTQRLCEATGQNAISAGCLLQRGNKEVEGGYTWRTDPRIKGSGPLELTNDQLDILLKNTRARTLLIVADMQNPWLRRSLEVIKNRKDPSMTLVSLPGHHHLHMQEQAGPVIELIRQFLLSEDTIPEPARERA